MPVDGKYAPSLDIKVIDKRNLLRGGNCIVGATSINLQK